MEKLDLQKFRELRQEIIDYMNKYNEAEETGEYLSSEEQEKYFSRYKEIIEILSEHDLSDIDFEEWRGMILVAYDECPLDFSKTKANLDFSILEYDDVDKAYANFKSCQIKNFDFENYDYSSEMFDEEFRKENEGRFLSPNIPEEVAVRFFEGNLTLTDIKNYPELTNKIEEKNLAYGLGDIYKIIGREEFCKLDAQFIDKTRYEWTELINSNPNLRTAEEIMPVLYKCAREKIIGYTVDDENRRFYYSQEELGDRFKKENPDLFLSDEVPENVRKDYYGHSLLLQDFSENLQYFEGKTIAQAFEIYGNNKKIISLYGEGVYQLFADYKTLMDKVIKDNFVMSSIEVPSGPVTEEERKKIMNSAIYAYITGHGFEDMHSWDEVKMILDFITIEQLPLTTEKMEFIEKYGIDTLIKSGLDMKYLFKNSKMSSLEEISSLKGIDIEDIKKLVDEKSERVLENYDIKQLLKFGINDLSELSEEINDLNKVKEMLEKRPIDLINMGYHGEQKSKFIERYGIDNIIALDEETGGMFSNGIGDEIYLILFALEDGKTPGLDTDNKLTYEEFRDRMYDILLHARGEKGILTFRDLPGYDFIQGKFREEHQDIFLDGELPEDIKDAFYTRHMNAEMVRQNPKLIQLLQGKDLGRAFNKTMIAGMSMQEINESKDEVGIPNTVNMAQYLSEELGQEEFLKICADYGKCLDAIGIMTKGEVSVESVRETIEQEIYKGIKEKGIEYFEELPLSFQEKHPELFLPKEVDETLRNKFYAGNLAYENIRQKPQIKELLLTKDISVGFGRRKYGQDALGRPGGRLINPLWEKLTEREIMDLAEIYGKYLKDVNPDIFIEGQSDEDRTIAVQENIEENILNRKSPFDEYIPDFFKQRHPKMFLDINAPEELKMRFYDVKKSVRWRYELPDNHKDDPESGYIDFEIIKNHPEWKEFLQGKDLSRAFSKEYSELFKKFDSSTLMKLGTRNPEAIDKMVQNHKENILESWYKSTGGKFVPHHVVMLNFPEGEIDSFLANSKRWSQLMKIENYNLNDDGKAAILKASYALGVFQGDDDGFNKTMKLFTDVPQELTQEEYEKVSKMFVDDVFVSPISSVNDFDPFDSSDSFGLNENDIDTKPKDEEMKSLFEKVYTLNDDGKYIFNIDKQKNKDIVKMVREILEKAQIPRILTPEKAHQIFDSFAMEYNPDFVKFFSDNVEEILSNSEYTKDIATMQRQFKDIVRTNAGRRLTLGVAKDYIKNIVYEDIEVGNERVAEQAKIAGYSQKDFEAIQSLFNEGEVRDFSSIPRIQGSTKGYTYEILRCDDPLALTIGTLTDCCQEIHGAGQTSMEHSVVSPDGRVFCVRDTEGRLVAQSWFWRNQYTGCFDNIEIPHRIFELYEKEHPDVGRKGLTKDVLEVYKKAARELMQEDERVYKELLENGTITQEQYDALVLGRITIGAGYNDIKFSLREAHKRGEFGLDQSNEVLPKKTDRLSYIYDDAHYADDDEHDGQYIVAEREGTVKSEHENLYVHQDDIPVFDGTNMSSILLLTMKRMEQATERDNLTYLSERRDEENLPKSQRIINSIAREYGFDPNDTRVMATARMALIYSKDKDNKVKIGDLLYSPLKTGLTEEQKQKATSHIMYQVKKALKQIGMQDSDVDLSSLSEEQKQMIQSVMQEIEKENDERGER